MKIEVLTRKKCEICDGKGLYLYVGSHDVESTQLCRCAERTNPAGKGFVPEWLMVEVLAEQDALEKRIKRLEKFALALRNHEHNQTGGFTTMGMNVPYGPLNECLSGIKEDIDKASSILPEGK